MTLTAALLTALWKTIIALSIGALLFFVGTLLVCAIFAWIGAIIDDHSAESPTNCNYMGRNVGNRK